jgi:Concanavalin A-like lectin/glucanases superfamily
MSILFDGSSQTLFFGTGCASLQNVPAATLMCWVLPSSTPDPGDIFGLAPGGADADTDNRAYLIGNSGTVRVVGKATDGSGGISQADGSQTFVAGELCHLTGVLDYVGNRIALYKNGVERFNVAASFGGVNTSNTTSNGGAIGGDGNGVAAFFPGRMEDCRIYSRVLSINEILTIFTARGKDGIIDGLENRYMLSDQPPGVTATASNVVDIGRQRFVLNSAPGNPTFNFQMACTPRKRPTFSTGSGLAQDNDLPDLG